MSSTSLVTMDVQFEEYFEEADILVDKAIVTETTVAHFSHFFWTKCNRGNLHTPYLHWPVLSV